jgi:FlaA1/EpsC-like NDP-sugar epimerase
MGVIKGNRLWHVGVDALVVMLAWYAAFYFRFDGTKGSPVSLGEYDRLRDHSFLWVVGIKLAIFVAMGLYSRWWRYVSLRDLELVGLAAALSTAAWATFLYVEPAYRSPRRVRRAGVDVFSAPKSIIVLDLLFTLFGMIAVRAIARSAFERPGPGWFSRSRDTKGVLIIGGGDAGQLVVKEMQRKTTRGFHPMGVLDDDPGKIGTRLHGVRVLGPIADLAEVITDNRPDEVVIAMPAAAGSVRRQIAEVATAGGVRVRTLPSVSELLQGDLNLVEQLREVRVEDVLGREPVFLDAAAIGGYATGKVVLVTGAGGSIGSEICRQLARLEPSCLVLVDHAENNLFEIERNLAERGFDAHVPVIADVRDRRLMRGILAEHRPAVIFHAAAYKHVPMMELNPGQAIRNNTLATRLMAELAREAGVERFVLVSTDKAVAAQTVMGATKALCELVIEAAAQDPGVTRFLAVRFGNVLGSSGSVIPIFRRQIEAGGPVTVTHAEMTRFFMTIPEAAQLVIQAGGVGDSGDLFVLDMGDPVRILDLAYDMIRLSGREPDRDVEVRVVGIRPGEKLHEQLFDDDEVVDRVEAGHDKLQRARRARIDADWLTLRLAEIEDLLEAGDSAAAAALVIETARSPQRQRPASEVPASLLAPAAPART